MKTYTFHTGHPPVEARFLFNTIGHTLLQSSTNWHYLYALQHKQCMALATLHIDEGKARAPLRAPFGGIECFESVTPSMLYDFLNFIEQYLQHEGVTELCVTMPPMGYYPEGNQLIPFFLNKGYSASAEISSLIPVTSNPYRDTVHEWELRKLKQASENGITVSIEPADRLATIYTFIEQCRAQKGYTLSMPLDKVQQLQQTFPERVVLFSARSNEELVAACIGIRVSADVLYTFYYDHNARYNAQSPVVLLLERIYDYCAANNIKHVDLGTATTEGEPNLSLLQFKQHVGGTPSPKFSFTKKW